MKWETLYSVTLQCLMAACFCGGACAMAFICGSYYCMAFTFCAGLTLSVLGLALSKRLMATAACVLLLLAPAIAHADWAKHTDGYWYANGDLTKPHERYEDTCWKNVSYADCCGGSYTKRVAYTCLKYRPVAVADPQTGIERFAQQLLAIKQGEMKSEWKLREQYAFAKEAASLADAFGVTQYRVQGYGQNLNYGDPEYQYPALSGNTQYGVKEYAADFYGNAAQTLVDVNQTIAMQHEVQKLQQQYASESNETWKQYTTQIVEGAGENTAVLAQIQQQNETIALLGQTMQSLIEASKPDVASVRTRETVPYGYEQPLGLSASPTAEGFQAVLTNSCAGCHDEHVAVKSKTFPAGVDFSTIAQWTQKQRDKAVVDVGTGRMPKGKTKLVAAEKQAFVNHVISLERN
jgi:hypothetical protein